VFVSLVVAVVAALRAWRIGQELWLSRETSAGHEARIASLNQLVAERDRRLAELGRFKVVVDAELRAKVVLSEATADAARVLDQARLDSRAMVLDAEEQKRRVEAARAEAQAELDTAAEKQKKLEVSARALKNVVDGYGDQYVVPTFSLLDELAEQFGFEEAGAKLGKARERVRQMVKDRTAAVCDYVEENRRTTAIDFVVDAFNGKVDSTLAGLRHDNFGTLEQRIKDAFEVVNLNGQAFRSARITPEYLKARLEELKWAVVVHELKLRDREEQRALRERIREEEQAQKEIERALKETEKEEALLRKAIEKARREVEKASDEQKAKYEAQLAGLAEQLKEAEEKNQRALSMAQQTKAGHVYVISNEGSFGADVFKIGLTRRIEPLDRIRELGDASVPLEFDIHALIRSEDAPALERELHRLFVVHQVNKVNPRKEFFRVPLQQIREAVQKLGLQVQWNLAAECREYKETLAIEKAMANKSREAESWIRSQAERKSAEEKAA
jgi:hypothetical protein